MNYYLDKELMTEWTNTLVNHSLASQFREKGTDLKGKTILIQGEVCSEELMVRVNDELIDVGAIPILRPFFSNVDRRNLFASSYALKHGILEQFSFMPKSEEELFKEIDGFVTIQGTENPKKFVGIEPKNIAISKKKHHPINENYRLRKIWTLTLFPTLAESLAEGLDYEEYADFVMRASISDYTLMQKEQEFLAKELTTINHIRIRSYNPLENRICELNMQKGNNLGLSCYGQYNVPDGEVFTSPYANTLEGEIFFDIPIWSNGLIADVYLKFEKGLIVDYKAKQGQELLKGIIETDRDSHKMGEFAIGTNYNVTRNLRNVLFTEKIGGSIHMAIGCSYEEPYNLKKLDGEKRDERKTEYINLGIYSDSAQHIDIPKDFRNPKTGEGLWLDDKELAWTGKLWKYK